MRDQGPISLERYGEVSPSHIRYLINILKFLRLCYR